MIYLLTAIGLTPGSSSTVHIYTQTVHRTTQNKQYIEEHNNLWECGSCPVLARFNLEFALQLRKKHGKTSVRTAASKNTQTTHRQLYQPTNAFNKLNKITNHQIQYTTNKKLLHVSAPDCHLQGFYQNKGIHQNIFNVRMYRLQVTQNYVLDSEPPARLLIQTHEKHPLKSACTNGLPDDENMMFETCRRHQEMN